MKYLDEFRDPTAAKSLVEAIRRSATQTWTIMEVCGGQTHSIIRNGIDQLLDGAVEFIHGPGCPVCVTPLEMIDRALEIASRDDVIFCSFGEAVLEQSYYDCGNWCAIVARAAAAPVGGERRLEGSSGCEPSER